MLIPLTALDFSVFSLGGVDMLAQLKTFSFSAVNDQVDAAGLSDRYSVHQTVKQAQTVDFTVFLPLVSGLMASNLDITLWTIGGTSYLTSIRKGLIDVTTLHKDRSSIADAFRYPSAVRTQTQITTEKLVIGSASFVQAMVTGSVASFDVTASITFGGTAFSCPMSLKSARHTVDRDELQMEEVTLTLAGTPIGPSDSSLLGNILLGTALVTLNADSGGGTYATGSGKTALITRLKTHFQDANLIEQSGSLALQGSVA